MPLNGAKPLAYGYSRSVVSARPASSNARDDVADRPLKLVAAVRVLEVRHAREQLAVRRRPAGLRDVVADAVLPRHDAPSPKYG